MPQKDQGSTASDHQRIVKRSLDAFAAGHFSAATSEFIEHATSEITGGEEAIVDSHRLEGKSAIEDGVFDGLVFSVYDFEDPFALESQTVDAASSKVFGEPAVVATGSRGGRFHNEYRMAFRAGDGPVTDVRSYADTLRHKCGLFG